MRHSSWTVFMIPLALPLVLLCLPGARGSLDGGTSAEIEVQDTQIEQPTSASISEAPLQTDPMGSEASIIAFFRN